MPNLLEFKWKLCPDGYRWRQIVSDDELEDYFEQQYRHKLNEMDPGKAAKVEPRWKRSTLNRFHVLEENSERIIETRPLDQAPGLFMEFAHTKRTADTMLNFVNKYGRLHSSEKTQTKNPRLKREAHWANRGDYDWEFRQFSEKVVLWEKCKETGNYDALISDLNRDNHVLVSGVRIKLSNVSGLDVPVLSLQPENLKTAINLQLAQSISSNQHLRRCAWCPTWFAYGTGTGRRKSAHYCSDRCRKAANRDLHGQK
jgi:hypothetical protein